MNRRHTSAKSDTDAARPETHRFQVSQAIIRHLIERQAGSIEKALLETVMNAIDAKATQICIDFHDRERITIVDNGRGFGSREAIRKHFGVFGFSHASDEERKLDRELGKFGLGRGQIMAFGSTRWRTGPFEMSVDIRESDLVFGLVEREDAHVDGCRIEVCLYDRITRVAQAATVDEIRKQVRYSPIEVLIDGKRVNIDCSGVKWTRTTEQFWFKLGTNARKGVAVYNRGIYVCTYPHHRVGVSGVLVSRRGHSFELNTARNDVLQSQCPLWKKALLLFEDESEKDQKKGRISDDDRMAIFRKIRTGEADASRYADVPLFKTVHGRHMTPRQLVRHSKGVITVAESMNSRVGERVHNDRVACVLAPEMVDWLDVADDWELTRKLEAHFDVVAAQEKSQYVLASYEEVSSSYSERSSVIAKVDWTKTEFAALSSLDKLSADVSARMEPKRRKRTVKLGESGTALAWTDGKSYIVFDRTYLHENIDRGLDGWDALLATMVHEYAHREPDLRDHHHDAQFYEDFHETVSSPRYRGWRMVADGYRNYAIAREAIGLKLSRVMSEEIDRMESGALRLPF